MTCRDWPKTQLPASFKGVGFDVAADNREGGRRVVTHEYPSREYWDNEDLGKLAQRVAVQAYVTGDDADIRSQRLIAACSTRGPGLLVLPVRPPTMARCLLVSSTFEADAMGRFVVEMEFVLESGGIGGIFPRKLLAGFVAESGFRALDVFAEMFGRRFDLLARRSADSRVPAVARDAAARSIEAAGRALRAARGNVVISDPEAATELDALIRQMINNAVGLAYQGQKADRVESGAFVRDQAPSDSLFAQRFTGAMSLLARRSENADGLAAAAAALARFEAPETLDGPDCRSVRMERALSQEIAGLVRRAAITVQAIALTRVSFGSRAEAAAARAEIARATAMELRREVPLELSGGDAALEAAMAETRDAAVDYLSRAGAELPATIRVSLRATKPAAVVAAALYEDATRDADLVRRNHAPHPNFMPMEIEALRPQDGV